MRERTIMQRSDELGERYRQTTDPSATGVRRQARQHLAGIRPQIDDVLLFDCDQVGFVGKNQNISLRNREIEVAHVLEALRSGQPRREELNKRYAKVDHDFDKKAEELRKHERLVGVAALSENADPDDRTEIVVIEHLRRDRRVAEARRKELQESLAFFLKADATSLSIRRREIQRETSDKEKLLKRCKWAQPFVSEYLPDESFKTLVLLIGLIMLGVAMKGFFMFLQEVLVADVMQLSLFDIRNMFFRRSINLDLASFSDQGSSELMARFTSDMDSFGQGLNTLMSKVMREPMRIVTFLTGALWINWRLTCLTLILIPISGATTYRVGKIMKRAVRRSLESMSTIYKILQESFQGIKIVKAFAMERVEHGSFR